MTKLVWRNLMRNKRRTVLTIASVALALLLLTLLGTLLEALTEAQGSTANRIVVRHAISLTFPLPEAYEQRLRGLEHVEAVTILNWFQGVYKNTRPENFFPRFATDAETLFDVFPEYRIPAEQIDAWKADRRGFIAGRALAEQQGWELGDTITIKGDIYPVDVELVLRGIFTHPDGAGLERQIFFHRRYVEEAMGNPGVVSTYFVKLDSQEAVPQVVRTVEAMFANSADQVRAETEEAFALSFASMLGNVRFLFGAIGLAIVVSIFFITANTMAMAARERTTEVAVLRTLGFRRSRVVAVVVAEALLVGLAGAALGVVLAAGLLRLLGSVMQQMSIFVGDLAPAPETLLVGVVVGLAIGALSGVGPAVIAARLPIVDGLRQVG